MIIILYIVLETRDFLILKFPAGEVLSISGSGVSVCSETASVLWCRDSAELGRGSKVEWSCGQHRQLHSSQHQRKSCCRVIIVQ